MEAWLVRTGSLDGDDYWDSFISEGVMRIGWNGTDDFSSFCSPEELKQHVRSKGYNRGGAKSCVDFMFEVRPGDLVVTRDHSRQRAAVGVVESRYYFQPRVEGYRHFRQVSWAEVSPENLPSGLPRIAGFSRLRHTREAVLALAETACTADGLEERPFELARRRMRSRLFRCIAIRYWGGACALSGCSAEVALEACHIHPVSEGGCDFVQNSIILRADLHALFDAGLLTFRSDGVAIFHSSISRDYQELDGKRIDVPLTMDRDAVLQLLSSRPLPRAAINPGTIHDLRTAEG
ncbi:HNH endonuclease [Caenispirillum salinarum]|uniref:HNH endonuclease n=1 Tax=Caenispirillum salinarum TaxID=859058 RepID=UPI000A2F5AD1|nr:HNH endonuclease [Caenispirillum salinarum]